MQTMSVLLSGAVGAILSCSGIRHLDDKSRVPGPGEAILVVTGSAPDHTEIWL